MFCATTKISSMETQNAPPPCGPLNPFFPTLKTLCLKLITHDLQKKTETETKQKIKNYCEKLPENLLSELIGNLQNPIKRLKCGTILKISPDQNYLLCEHRKMNNQYYTYTLYQNSNAQTRRIHSRKQHIVSNLSNGEIAFTDDTIALINQVKTSIELFKLPQFELLFSIDREEFGRSTVIDFADRNTLIGYQKIFGQKIHALDLITLKSKSINWSVPITKIVPTITDAILVVNNIDDQHMSITFINARKSSANKIAVIKIFNGLPFINDITHNKDLVAFASNRNVYIYPMHQDETPTNDSVVIFPNPTFKLKSPIQCLRFNPDNTHLAIAHAMTQEEGPFVSIITLDGKQLFQTGLTVNNISWNKELIMQPINPHEHAPIIRQLPEWALDTKKKIKYKRTLARFAHELIEDRKKQNNNNA